MDVKFNIGRSDYNDLVAYCSLNNLEIQDVIKKSYLEGFRIEKYGLLNSKSEVKEVIKEVIKTIEVPVEIIKEIPKIEYVEIEKHVEIIKEIPVVEYVEVIKEVPSPPVEVEVIKYVDKEVIREVFIEKDVSNLDNFYEKKYVDELKEKIFELENKPPEIKEIPVEIIKEVIIEKISPVETIKEIIVEKHDESLKVKLDALQQTVMKLKQENIDKSDTISELKKKLEETKKYEEVKPAIYLQGSNLNNKLIK